MGAAKGHAGIDDNFVTCLSRSPLTMYHIRNASDGATHTQLITMHVHVHVHDDCFPSMHACPKLISHRIPPVASGRSQNGRIDGDFHLSRLPSLIRASWSVCLRCPWRCAAHDCTKEHCHSSWGEVAQGLKPPGRLPLHDHIRIRQCHHVFVNGDACHREFLEGRSDQS